jgi:hypothetical protein
MVKRVYAASMSYEVPDEDRERAEKANDAFDYLLRKIHKCDEHLDLIYTPFKDNSNISPEQLYKVRAALRRYRDRVSDNFNALKRISFKCFVRLQPFSTDTSIAKLSKAFVVSIGDVEKQVNRFIELFGQLDSKDFPANLVKSVEAIKKEMAKLEQIVEDRIIKHITENVLARSWVDGVSEELQEKVEQKVPLSIRMVEKRNGEEPQNG